MMPGFVRGCMFTSGSVQAICCVVHVQGYDGRNAGDHKVDHDTLQGIHPLMNNGITSFSETKSSLWIISQIRCWRVRHQCVKSPWQARFIWVSHDVPKQWLAHPPHPPREMTLPDLDGPPCPSKYRVGHNACVICLELRDSSCKSI